MKALMETSLELYVQRMISSDCHNTESALPLNLIFDIFIATGPTMTSLKKIILYATISRSQT